MKLFVAALMVMGLLGCGGGYYVPDPKTFTETSTLTWEVTCNYKNGFKIGFFSQNRDRCWHVMPEGGYTGNMSANGTTMRYGETKTFNINCGKGEIVCWGAWIPGTTSYWGAGYNRTKWCADCCSSCNGQTLSITLSGKQ